MEISKNLNFNTKGMLAMAGEGPNTDSNSSHFYITATPVPSINGRDTIFGKVIEGMDVVEKISQVKTTKDEIPVDEVILKRTEVLKKRDHEYHVKKAPKKKK